MFAQARQLRAESLLKDENGQLWRVIWAAKGPNLTEQHHSVSVYLEHQLPLTHSMRVLDSEDDIEIIVEREVS